MFYPKLSFRKNSKKSILNFIFFLMSKTFSYLFHNHSFNKSEIIPLRVGRLEKKLPFDIYLIRQKTDNKMMFIFYFTMTLLFKSKVKLIRIKKQKNLFFQSLSVFIRISDHLLFIYTMVFLFSHFFSQWFFVISIP